MALDSLKITSYEDGVSELPDNPSDAGITAAQLKAVFDARSNKEIKEQHNALVDEVARHESGENPHGITKEIVGLSKVDNTSDEEKPVSVPQREAIDNAKEEVLKEISVIEGPPGPQGEPGPQGADGISCTHYWNGTILTIGSASGVSSVDLKGDKGDKGEQGPSGADGVSPAVYVRDIPGGHRVTIKDENGTKSFDVMGGENGADGGYYIPTVAHVTDEVIQFAFSKSKSDMPNVDLMYIDLPRGANGQDGYTPIRGIDYWRDEDKAEIKSYVDDAILGGAW